VSSIIITNCEIHSSVLELFLSAVDGGRRAHHLGGRCFGGDLYGVECAQVFASIMDLLGK